MGWAKDATDSYYAAMNDAIRRDIPFVDVNGKLVMFPLWPALEFAAMKRTVVRFGYSGNDRDVRLKMLYDGGLNLPPKFDTDQNLLEEILDRGALAVYDQEIVRLTIGVQV